jgi:hypothetical protein
MEEWAIAVFGKGGGVFGSGMTSGTTELTTLSGTTTVGSWLELKVGATLGFIEKAALPAMAVTTAVDIGAHIYCSPASGPAGTMPLPK